MNFEPTDHINCRIIGLAGRQGVGKTTFAKRLQKLIPNSMVYSFAGPVKEILHLLSSGAYDPVSEDNKELWRSTLQTLGQGIRDLFGEDVWLTCLSYNLPDDPGTVVIIDDVRYQNEVEWIQYVGGEVWYCKREGYEPPLSEHQSECLPDILCDRVVWL